MRVETINPVVTDGASGDLFLKAAGMLKKTTIDGVAFQKNCVKSGRGGRTRSICYPLKQVNSPGLHTKDCFTRTRSGMALLNVIMLVILVGVMVIAGYKMMGPIIQRGKINDTKTIIKSDVDAIISWTVTNCRIPDAGATTTGFANVVQNPNDAWGNQLSYLYAPELANNSSCAQICGLKDSKFFVSGVTDSVAFVISSSQYSAAFHNQFPIGTKLNGTTLTVPTLVNAAGGYVEGTLNQLVTDPPDILRVVTLNELKARIGCSGHTQGQLRILNNELPNACAGSSSYSAKVYGGIGATPYTWSLPTKPSWLTIDADSGALSIPSGSSVPSATGTHSVTAQLTDFNGTQVQRTYNLKVVSCGGYSITIPPGTPPDPPVQGTNNPGFDANDPSLISFGLDKYNSAGCVWYPQNLPLFGKTMRAYWSFCYVGSDTSATSTQYADGYTFSMMQASNPTSYCGTGTTYNAVTNPRYDCSVWGGAGEYLAYCGLPGSSSALEFDIYPSGNRNDPAGSYNHIAIVNAYNHTTGVLTGLFGDNTHNRGGNPACTTTSTGCLYDSMTGHTYPVTWLENTGCNTARDNHNARVEVHTRCNSDCSQCGTATCTTKTLTKVWIDRGNSNLDANDTTPPDMSYCADQTPNLAQYRVGFTEATGGSAQYGYIKNFSLKSVGACPLATIAPDTLPNGMVGVPYSATLSATGGTPPYSWSWSASNIPGSAASSLPPGLTLNAAGVISGTPTVAGTYNAVLVSASDACTADGCTNTVSKSYTITINPAPAPSCTLTAAPSSVANGATTTFNWTITNGPANGSWSPAPGGSCSNFSSSTGGSCTSGPLTIPGANIYTLTVSNASGSSNCSATVNVSGCAGYRVWNTTGDRYDFYVAGSCRNNINNGNEITNSTVQLAPGGTVSRDGKTGLCNPSKPLGSITYSQAVAADLDGDCMVNYGAGDTVTDR